MKPQESLPHQIGTEIDSNHYHDEGVNELPNANVAVKPKDVRHIIHYVRVPPRLGPCGETTWMMDDRDVA